jgi:hypothetical protein
MRNRITKEIFDLYKSSMMDKDDIKLDQTLILFVHTPHDTYWQVEVDVWYDSSVGNGLLPKGDKDMVLTEKKTYGVKWYLTK